jgi:hypothetical protein
MLSIRVYTLFDNKNIDAIRLGFKPKGLSKQVVDVDSVIYFTH